MQITSGQFKQRARDGLENQTLRESLVRARGKFVVTRRHALDDLGNAEALRTAATAARDHVLERLDVYLERFEAGVQKTGGAVLWAEDTNDVQRLLRDIVARHAVRTIVKSKSMVTEECAVNEALEASGIKVVETDLGEYILQLAKEPPSHIVAPVVHKSKEDIATLFEQHHGGPRKTGIAELCREAREVLRPAFLTADMGISGANFLIAETGSALIVTNEGNGRLVTTLPRVHVVITGIEKWCRRWKTRRCCCDCSRARPPASQSPIMSRCSRDRGAPMIPTARNISTLSWWTTAARNCSAANCSPCCAASAAARA